MWLALWVVPAFADCRVTSSAAADATAEAVILTLNTEQTSSANVLKQFCCSLVALANLIRHSVTATVILTVRLSDSGF